MRWPIEIAATDAAAVATALAAGLVLGMMGALLPGWRCLRLPIMDALRTA
jgi:hypothetical protein